MAFSRTLVAPAVLGALALAVAGCGLKDASAQPPAGGVAAVGAVTATDMRAIVGTWTVGGDGVEAGTTIRFGRDLQLTRPCGISTGAWLASEGGALVAFVTSLAETCPPSSAGDATTA